MRFRWTTQYCDTANMGKTAAETVLPALEAVRQETANMERKLTFI